MMREPVDPLACADRISQRPRTDRADNAAACALCRCGAGWRRWNASSSSGCTVSPAASRSGAAAAYLPLSGDDNGWAFFIDGRPPKPVGVYDFAKYRRSVTAISKPSGRSVVQGREFISSDDHEAPFVAVINQAMAGKFWSGQEAVGQRIRFGGRRSAYDRRCGRRRASRRARR